METETNTNTIDPEAHKKRLRKVLIAGAIIGAGLSVATSLLMDLLFADSLQGSWRDAVAGDLQRYFSMQVSPESALAWIGFLLVLGFLATVGAAIGAFFAYLVFKFISILES